LESGVFDSGGASAESGPERLKADLKRSVGDAVRLDPSAGLRLIREDAVLERRLADGRMLQQACDGLARTRPELSAKSGLSDGQRHGLRGLMTCAAVSAFIAPQAVIAALAGAATTVFAGAIALKIAAALSALVSRPAKPTPRKPDDDLTTITYLVPLYREHNVAPALVKALLALDYPANRLDIKLLVEIDDDDTIRVLRGQALPPHFEILPCPPSQPRTKPKALNFGLAYAKGQIIAVLDAEDIPDPGQPRAADHAFATGPKDLAVVQAPLAAHNGRAGWIAGQFEVEYAVHFGVWLPFLARMRWPIALGGTSNYFRRAHLESAGGWDAWNVTEDADLGLRLARFGKHAAMIAPPTQEEAPVHFRDWLAQRTRWKKGHLQSWLVLMRDPARTLRDMGLWSFIGTQVTLGGALLAATLHAPVIFGFALAAALGLGWPSATYLALFGASYGALILSAVATRSPRRVLASLMAPVYLPLMSIAMLRALWEIRTRPHFWAKTPHGVAK
jgi:cellulose synthase/poly-beta-1,6-N-acetylglucosamine synthase-like glycosyltransferase